MLHYFVDYGDRDFANVYDVLAVEAKDSAEFRDAFPGAARITRNEAIRLGWTRPREAKRYGEQWFGGFRTTWGDGTTLDETIADCVATTRGLMGERAAMTEMR